MSINDQHIITANQHPEKKNYSSRFLRTIQSYAPHLGIIASPNRPPGISVIMRVKNEKDWVTLSIQSIKSIADEIVVVDNGSSDGTYDILTKLTSQKNTPIRLSHRPDLDLCALSNFALNETRFQWVFCWDGDMVAHTTGRHSISNLRDRILSLGNRRYYVIYLRHINLSGDLSHQDPNEMVHIEEYIHTFSPGARYVHPGRFEAIKVPRYYRVLFWYEPYSFHVNVKPAKRMLLRYFWEDWMALKDYQRFPTLDDYVNANIEREFRTTSWKEAQKICLQKICQNYIPYDPEVFGPYPELLKPHLERPKYQLEYENGKIVGRDEK